MARMVAWLALALQGLLLCVALAHGRIVFVVVQHRRCARYLCCCVAVLHVDTRCVALLCVYVSVSQ